MCEYALQLLIMLGLFLCVVSSKPNCSSADKYHTMAYMGLVSSASDIIPFASCETHKAFVFFSLLNTTAVLSEASEVLLWLTFMTAASRSQASKCYDNQPTQRVIFLTRYGQFSSSSPASGASNECCEILHKMHADFGNKNNKKLNRRPHIRTLVRLPLGLPISSTAT